jgi:hypothetical protein
VRVQGDEVMDFSRWVKVPEAYERAEAKSGWRDLIARELYGWTSLALFGVLTALFVTLVRRGLAPWRLGFTLALFPLALNLAESANNLPWFFSGYTTTTPLASFLTKQLLGGPLVLP